MSSLFPLEFSVVMVHKTPAAIQWRVLFKTIIIIEQKEIKFAISMAQT